MAGPGGGLSKTWSVVGQHADSFTGGRVCLSPCQQWLVCWCSESISLLSIATGQVVRKFTDDNDGFLVFAINPIAEAQELATVQRSGMIRIWSTDTGKVVREWRGPKLPITAIAFDSTGKHLATGGSDRIVKVWNAAKGFASHSFAQHNDIVTVVAFHPDPSAFIVYSGARDGSLFAWNLRTNAGSAMANHMSAITDLAIDADSERLLSVGRDQVLNVWAAESFELLHTIPTCEEVEALAWVDAAPATTVQLPNCTVDTATTKLFATVGANHVARIWSLADLSVVYAQDPPSAPSSIGLTGVLSRRQGDLILVTSDHNIHVRDLATFDQTKCILGFNDEILDICCLPDNRRAIVATNSELIRVIDLDTFDANLLSGHTAVVLGIAITTDGRYLASASKDNTVRVWDVETNTCLAVQVGHTGSVNACAWAPRSSSFVCSVSLDRTLKLWPFSPAASSQASPRTIVAHDKDINAVAVSPNDRLIATASQDRTVKLWSSDDLSPVATLKGHRRGIWSVAFSPVDKCLATASGDRTIRIWSLTDYSCVKTFEGHTSSVLRVCFLSMGMQLLSSGADGLVKLWTIHSSECVSTFDEAHTEKIWALTLTPDQTRMVTGGADSLINVWRDVTVEQANVLLEEQQGRIKLEQQLRNALRSGEIQVAARLAVQLDNPRHLYSLLDGISDQEVLSEIVREWTDPNVMVKCLEWITQWNTNSKRCLVGQRLLRAIFSSNLDALMTAPSMIRTLQSLISYSERHFQRLDRLVRKSFLLDFAIESIGDLMPIEDETAAVSDREIDEQSDGNADTGVDEIREEGVTLEDVADAASEEVGQKIIVEGVAKHDQTVLVEGVPSRKKKSKSKKKRTISEMSAVDQDELLKIKVQDEHDRHIGSDAQEPLLASTEANTESFVVDSVEVNVEQDITSDANGTLVDAKRKKTSRSPKKSKRKQAKAI